MPVYLITIKLANGKVGHAWEDAESKDSLDAAVLQLMAEDGELASMVVRLPTREEMELN